MSTQTLDKTELDPITGEPRASHLVGPQGEGDQVKYGATLVMEARINGTEVEALCGYRWIPERNPESYPVCQKCLEIFQGATGKSDDWELS